MLFLLLHLWTNDDEPEDSEHQQHRNKCLHGTHGSNLFVKRLGREGLEPDTYNKDRDLAPLRGRGQGSSDPELKWTQSIKPKSPKPSYVAQMLG